LNAETPESELSLPNAVQQLDASDRGRGISEALETGITAMRGFTP
jgi:hypothetical protein